MVGADDGWRYGPWGADDRPRASYTLVTTTQLKMEMPVVRTATGGATSLGTIPNWKIRDRRQSAVRISHFGCFRFSPCSKTGEPLITEPWLSGTATGDPPPTTLC